SALKAVFKHNFKSDLTGWKHSPRAFAGAKDKGLIICTWPNGGRPGNVMLYSDEVWTGIEYQVAAHLMYEGMLEEGLAIVKGARERYDGVPRAPLARNPWNEIECGGHYARAMSSWSLLLALSGWHYDAPRGGLQFAPRYQQEQFRGFFSGPEGWGSARQTRSGTRQTNEIHVSEGSLFLKEIKLEARATPSRVRPTLAGKHLNAVFSSDGASVSLSFAKPITVKAGQSLQVEINT
ncbi:MAG TPA: GH116 family glycosyl hydrolase, partial [Verrucomicrobiae bacterium]|nr:GH116 family glycosyl hydrolase [Verrucomicrobiae bacterium]